MLSQHIALLSTISNVSPGELAQVGAAIQRQVLRDLAPIWQITASVDHFPTIQDVPLGYWPILIVDEAPQPGSHTDTNGHPMAFVEYGPSWSLRASHEAIEMLVDPSGRRMVPGYSPQPTQDRVEFLVEVCDPCQIGCGYTVNGILVSDFCTPQYYDPEPTAGSHYDYCGKIRWPREVLAGGYLCWRDPQSGDWFQMNNLGDSQPIKNLGQLPNGPTGFRAIIDSQTPALNQLSHLREGPDVELARRARESCVRSAGAQAAVWRDEIAKRSTRRLAQAETPDR
jgi:hypothetical protein